MEIFSQNKFRIFSHSVLNFEPGSHFTETPYWLVAFGVKCSDHMSLLQEQFEKITWVLFLKL